MSAPRPPTPTSGEIPDFTGWTVKQLLDQKKHLAGILLVSAGQGDPDRPRLRAEHEAIVAEITRRLTCPACLDDRHGECEDPCKCPVANPTPAGEE